MSELNVNLTLADSPSAEQPSLTRLILMIRRENFSFSGPCDADTEDRLKRVAIVRTTAFIVVDSNLPLTSGRHGRAGVRTPLRLLAGPVTPAVAASHGAAKVSHRLIIVASQLRDAGAGRWPVPSVERLNRGHRTGVIGCHFLPSVRRGSCRCPCSSGGSASRRPCPA